MIKKSNNNHGKISLVTLLVDVIVIVSLIVGIVIYKTQKKGLDTYIGIDGCFMGSYENGKWYNAQNTNIEGVVHKEFVLEDIKKYPVFYYHAYGMEPIEYSDYIEYEGTLDDTFRFKAPKEIMHGDEEHCEIFTNNKEKVFTIENENVVISNSYDQIINEVKEKNGVSNVYTELYKCISVDYDKDSKNEKILIVNTKSDDLGYIQSQDGVCSFVIAVDDDRNYQVVYKFVITKENIANINGVEDQSGVLSALICDLNSDGNYELCINAYSWDVPLKYVYEFNKQFNIVLEGAFPW